MSVRGVTATAMTDEYMVQNLKRSWGEIGEC